MGNNERLGCIKMQKIREKISIVLASNNNYAPFVATTMYSILENTDSFIEFYILDDGISNNNKKKIIQSNKRFHHFSIEFIDMGKFCLGRFPNMKHYSTSCFARYFIPEVLPDKTKVLYLDVDIIAVNDIKKLYDQDLEGYPLGAVPEDFYECNYLELKNKIYPAYKDGSKYFNSGVLLMDIQKLRGGNYVGNLVDKTIELENLLNCPDQDVFNIVFENNYKVLDYRFNAQIDLLHSVEKPHSDRIFNQLAKHYPVIIHYTSGKPWMYQGIKQEEFWNIAKKTEFHRSIQYKSAKLVGKYYLFFFIPLIKVVQKRNTTLYNFFGMTILKKKGGQNG